MTLAAAMASPTTSLVRMACPRPLIAMSIIESVTGPRSRGWRRSDGR